MRAGWRLVVAHDGLDARINHAHRPPQTPRRKCEKWLHRQVQLGTEAAADGGWNNPHRFGSNPQKLRDIRAVHVWRLGAGLDLDLIADAPGKSRFRLDASMLDEAGFKFAFHDRVRFGQRFLYIASHHAPASQHVLRAMSMDKRSTGRESFIDGSERRQFLPAYREGCRIKTLRSPLLRRQSRRSLHPDTELPRGQKPADPQSVESRRNNLRPGHLWR